MIFERFNEEGLRFNNDQILEELVRAGALPEGSTTDDIAGELRRLQDTGIVRDIAQNFTTVWFKLFDELVPGECGSCGGVHVCRDEEACPLCGSAL